MATAEYKDRQEEELQVILAIFPEQVKDVRNVDAWKVWRSPEILVTCVPQSSDSMGAVSEKHVQINLHMTLSHKYPDEVPVISLEEAIGLSDKLVSELQASLVTLRSSLKGQEMMYELINQTQSFLYLNNKPPTKSFFEQMVSNNQREADEKKKEAEKIRQRKQMEEELEIEAELERQKNEIKEENRRKRQSRRISECQVTDDVTARAMSQSPRRHRDSSNSEKSTRSPSHESPVTTVCKKASHHKIEEIHFTGADKSDIHVMRGICTVHEGGSVVYAAFNANTGDPLSVKEWSLIYTGLKGSVTSDISKTYKLLKIIEQDLLQTMKVKEKHLIHYLAITTLQSNSTLRILVLAEQRAGVFLSCLPGHGSCDMRSIALVAYQMVEVLSYLHQKQLIHKDIRPSSVILDETGLVRLADYGLSRRITDLQQLVQNNDLDSGLPVTKRGQKEDVFRLGLVILYMITGVFNENERMPEIPASTPSTLHDFLNKCFTVNERTRWSMSQLASHAFLKPQISHVLKADNDQEVAGMKPAHDSDEEEASDHVAAMINFDLSSTSRLVSEFQLMEIIGKGGFGEVIKVRMKLDRQFYAIKKITLNPKSRAFNRKITREVKLLSRLNHENVVRYYNSWIETSNEIAVTDTSTMESLATTTTGPNKVQPVQHTSTNYSVEDNAPKMVEGSVAWSVLSEEDNSPVDTDSSSDEDDIGFFGKPFRRHSESDDVMFEGTGDGDKDNTEKSEEQTDSKESNISEYYQPRLQYMYIQMEFCEKSTLRSAIDMGLYEDLSRLWRLFREIIEGLVHIHEQGMIHRDLKPVNIFLDSNDHVKIGDFGLATTVLLDQLPEDTAMSVSQFDPTLSSRSYSVGDGHHTGRVGTPLYVCPEIKSACGKTRYDQKVDLYSLGIIFFEMCYRPLTTLMERDKILGSLRLPQVLLPEDFTPVQYPRQTALVKWLLNHDSEKRPTSQQLLQSDYMPPPEMEEAELNELIRSTIENPQSKGFKRMVSSIFNRKQNRTFEFSYDNDLHKGLILNQWLCIRTAKQRIHSVLSRHGALELSVPLLLPKLPLYESHQQSVMFMDHAGNLVCLPFDHKVPFARYVARNSITSLRRYCISPVYRERKPHGIHPHERWHCSFDVISSAKDSLVPDAEVLVICQELLYAFPVLQSKVFTIHINHSGLIQAILLHCGIPEQHHVAVMKCIAEHMDASSGVLSNRLRTLDINEQTESALLSFIEITAPFSKMSSFLRRITKSSQQEGSSAKRALHEIEAIISLAVSLGLKLEVLVNLGYLYDPEHCSGVMFQVVTESKKRAHKTGLDIFAGGYRYDKLVSLFSRVRSTGHSPPTAVGMSLLFDKLVLAASIEEQTTPSKLCDVVVLCTGRSAAQKQMLGLVKELWENDIHTEIITDNTLDIDSVRETCQTSGISILITMKDSDPDMVKVCSVEPERISGKKVSFTHALDEVKHRLTVDQKQELSDPTNKPAHKENLVEKQDTASTVNSLPIHIVWPTEKKEALKIRHKMENIIVSNLSNTILCHLKRSGEAEVTAFDLSIGEVKVIANVCADSSDEQQFDHNSQVAMERQESARQRKYMAKIFERLRNLKFVDRAAVLIVYGMKDNSFRAVLPS